ncbi:MAG TPA: PAS domain S-box protein, partial [Acidimicrobiales bacterium]
MAAVGADGALELQEIRFLTATGEARWMQVHSRAVDASQPHHSFVTGLQDIHERRSHSKLREALAAVDAVLVGADDESALLIGVCRVLVEQTPSELAWFARGAPGGGAVSIVAVEGNHGGLLPVGGPSPDAAASLAVAAIAALRSGVVECQLDDMTPEPAMPSTPGSGCPRFALTTGTPIEVDGVVELVLVDHRTDPPLLDDVTRATLDQLARQIGLALSRIRARSQLVDALNKQALLSTAIEQAGETVLVTDLDGLIAYANPATEALTGYPVAEIVGGTAERFASGLHGPEFFDRITEALQAGLTWRGVLVYKNRDDQLFEGETTITAMRDDAGRINAFVSVVRNISWELKLEADLDRLRCDRESVIAAMSGVRVGATIEATAASFCLAVTRLEDVELARVLLVEADDRVIPLGITGRAYLDWEVGVPVTFPQLADIVTVTRSGSWWQPLAELSEEGRATDPLIHRLVESGFASMGFAPVWWEESLVALVVTLSRTPEGGRWTEDRTTVLEELSSFAGSALGAQASRRGEWTRLQDE